MPGYRPSRRRLKLRVDGVDMAALPENTDSLISGRANNPIVSSLSQMTASTVIRP
jgi:hypothetical protein